MIFFLIVIYILTIYCFAYGNPKELNLPFDSDKHPCGTGIGLEEYKYIYFVNPHPDYIGRTLCVKKCPKLLPNQSETDESLSLECHPNTNITTCDIRSNVIDPKYMVLYYDSFPDKNVCLPTKLEYAKNLLPGLKKPLNQRIIIDIYNGRYIILAAVLFCLLCNIVQLYLIQIFPQEIMWLILSIAGLSIVLTTGFGYSLSSKVIQASQIDQDFLNLHQDSLIIHQDYIKAYVHAQYVNTDLMKYVKHVFMAQMVIFAFFIMYKYRGLDTFAKQLKCISKLSADYFAEIFWLTIMFTISLIVCLVFWVSITSCIFTLVKKGSDSNQSPFDNFVHNPKHYFLQLLQTIQLLIVSRVMIALHITILMGQVIETLIIKHNQKKGIHGSRKKMNICENLIKGTFNNIFIGEIIQSFLDISPIPIILIQKISGINKISYLTKYNDRMYFLSYFGNLPFAENAKLSQKFDQRNEQNGIIKNYGEAYTCIISLTMCNLSTSLAYFLITYSPIYTKIHNPLIFISVIYTLCYSISKLFGSMYGYTIECLVSTKNFKDISIKDDDVLSNVIQIQEEFGDQDFFSICDCC